METLAVLLALILSPIIGLITYRKGLLTKDGSIAATAMGIIISISHPSWLILLFGFLLAGAAVTMYHFRDKEKMGVQEGKKGERGYRNVLSTGAVPTIIALLSIPGYAVIPADFAGILFLIAIATAASDTLASEMGVLSEKTRLITSMKRVEPGENGGVSGYGTLWALIGAFGTAFLGGIFLMYFGDITSYYSITQVILAVGIFGFLGCVMDSILGATLENRGLIGKGMVNFLSEILAVLTFVILHMYFYVGTL